MRRVAAIIGSAIFLVIAPGLLAGLAPWWISHWQLKPGLVFVRIVGGVLLGFGLVGLLDSFARFAVQGLGTPAPVFPTRHLVVTGLYRYVRNPMYLAVVTAVVGQGLILGNATLLEYGGLIWLLFHAFVRLYEEPTLRRDFGSEYNAYCNGVRRWIPRFSAWTGQPDAP